MEMEAGLGANRSPFPPIMAVWGVALKRGRDRTGEGGRGERRERIMEVGTCRKGGKESMNYSLGEDGRME